MKKKIEEEREENAVNSGHLRQASAQGQRMHSARTKKSNATTLVMFETNLLFLVITLKMAVTDVYPVLKSHQQNNCDLSLHLTIHGVCFILVKSAAQGNTGHFK
jgi:hypothetical protein